MSFDRRERKRHHHVADEHHEHHVHKRPQREQWSREDFFRDLRRASRPLRDDDEDPKQVNEEEAS